MGVKYVADMATRIAGRAVKSWSRKVRKVANDGRRVANNVVCPEAEPGRRAAGVFD